MKSMNRLNTVLVVWAMGWWLGCGPAGDRCRKCGMLVDQHPRWIAGFTDERGAEERFCSPRCLFAHWRSPAGSGGHGAWVTEYYTQKRHGVDAVWFVAGSDVLGPMGRALVPIAGREAAEGFLRDHHGTEILSAQEITLDRLRQIAGAGPSPSPGATATNLEDLH